MTVDKEVTKSMDVMLPDYENCTVNLACSILKHFGGRDIRHAGMSMADRLLEKNYKNVVLILLDAMGKCVLDRNLDRDGFLNRHVAGYYSAVFPPTTVAATTSICSGLYPSEHGWLGWDCYYPPIDKNVTVFSNKETESGEEAASYSVAERYCSYKSVVEQIQEAGYAAYHLSVHEDPRLSSFAAICRRIEELCGEAGRKYIYAYWNEPDYTMHRSGVYSAASKVMARKLEAQVEKLCGGLRDTLILITADHGQVDTSNELIDDIPELLECLTRRPSLEPRAVNFFVKKGYEEQFRTAFQSHFGKKFLLMSKKDVKERRLFGIGREHSMFDGMLGDYLAVAVGERTLYSQRDKKEKFRAAHAGMTEDEMWLALVAIEKE